MRKKCKLFLVLFLTMANCLVSIPGVEAAEVTPIAETGTEANEIISYPTDYQTESLTLEYGDQGTLTVSTGVSVSYSIFTEESESEDLLTLDDQGNYQVTAVGDTTVIGRFYDSVGNLVVEKTYYITVTMDMTGVTLDSKSQTKYIYKDSWDYPSFEFHLKEGSKPLPTSADAYLLSAKSSNSSITVRARMEEGGKIVLTPNGVGKTTVTLTINRKRYTVTIRTVEVAMNKNTLLLVPKKTGKLKVTGLSGATKWSSSNSKVVSVSSSGVVTAKKNGNAVIKAKIGEFTVGCAVSVVSASRYKAIRKAIRIAKNGTYSQPKRMLEGYYDCSSLVWRAYRTSGINLARSSKTAPVAASLGLWCVQNKKTVKSGMSEKNVQAMKLNAGDLMFEGGSNNGRYRGIYHVEMIAGYCCKGFDSKGKPILGIVWANRPDDYYSHIGQLIGRP